MKTIEYFSAKLTGVDSLPFRSLHRYLSKDECIKEAESVISDFLTKCPHRSIVGEYRFERFGYFHQYCTIDDCGRYYLIELFVESHFFHYL